MRWLQSCGASTHIPNLDACIPAWPFSLAAFRSRALPSVLQVPRLQACWDDPEPENSPIPARYPLSQHLDLAALLEVAAEAQLPPLAQPLPCRRAQCCVQVAVAQDAAFRPHYHE